VLFRNDPPVLPQIMSAHNLEWGACGSSALHLSISIGLQNEKRRDIDIAMQHLQHFISIPLEFEIKI
jgi:hypothetical protein